MLVRHEEITTIQCVQNTLPAHRSSSHSCQGADVSPRFETGALHQSCPEHHRSLSARPLRLSRQVREIESTRAFSSRASDSTRRSYEVARASSTCVFVTAVLKDLRSRARAPSRSVRLASASNVGSPISSQISMILRLDVWSAALDRAAKATFQSGDSFVAMYPRQMLKKVGRVAERLEIRIDSDSVHAQEFGSQYRRDRQ